MAVEVTPRDDAGDPSEDRSRARVAGSLAAAVALTTTVVADALWPRVPSLVADVGQAFVRLVPGWFSRFGVSSAGSADKPLVLAGTVVIGLVIGAYVGGAARRRPVVGDLSFAAFGLLGVVCAAWLGHVSVAGAAVAAVAGALAGALSLRLLLSAARADDAADPPAAATRPAEPATPAEPAADDAEPAAEHAAEMPGSGVDRRRFLTVGALTAGGTALALVGVRGLRWPGASAGQRAAVRLPAPAEPAGAAPAGLDVEGISPLVVPNRDFYRIDEALVVPQVEVDSWRLKVTGMVDAPFELTHAELLDMPLIERHVTLSCVSNEVGGPLVGNAKWLGVRLADLLGRAGVQPGATQVVGRSVDRFTVGFPTSVALDGRDAMVAVGMNGEPLPAAHGFPARLVVPGLYGYVSATKWLGEIELTTWDKFDPYWVQRNWARQAPVKVESRIDVPQDFSQVPPGPRTVAGVAWAPHRGVGRVEVKVDDGPWRDARLSEALGDDAWRQWAIDWDARPGDHRISVRATTGDGETQPDVKKSVFPDGATGRHEVTVRVR
jgi:DMSO/TMAO reductase YedYZ molybdopterin-dependent catalytic subunit